MASRTLYPAILDSYMPAFQAGAGSYCRVYFSLSKFNSSSDFSSVHISVMKQNTGMNVVKTTDDPEIGHYRATGIILNAKATKVEKKDNLYYVDILNRDLSSAGAGYEGWIPGWTYKIQIRLSSKDYDGSTGQAAWINNNASFFSEWSTICIVKAIGKMDLVIPPINYDSQDLENDSNLTEIKTLYLSTLDFFGELISEDVSEVLYKYDLKIYDNNDDLLEDSGDLFSNKYQNVNEFKYLVKYEFENTREYKLEFHYVTNNGFEDTLKMTFICSTVSADKIHCTIVTADNDPDEILKDITSVHYEEEEGLIGLKLYTKDLGTYSGNICIRRASSKDNFTKWDDIKIYIARAEYINDIPIIYDYTAESGVWYKYGVQAIDKDGNRSPLNQTNPIMRNFEYSYLLGENNQQLKLMFNNAMGSFKIQKMDSKTDSIGGRYPVITRNAALSYKTFPVNGLISFWMDENNLFCDKKVIYKEDDIVNLYNNYNEEKGIMQYDYIYERDFRQLVLDFLQDGKPKLFKSPTEGNVIIRLVEVNCTPEQALDRMLYNFTSTAYELADDTVANYLKYNFLDPGEWGTDFSVTSTKLGQIQMAFTPEMNVFKEIYKKYDFSNMNLAGYTNVIDNVSHIKITIDDKPFRILNGAGEYVIGNNISINGTQITILNGVYEFDDRLTYTDSDALYLLLDAEGKYTSVNATIDFLYDLKSETYQEPQIQSKETKAILGQIFEECQPNASIYKEIYYKYFVEIGRMYRRLKSISSIEIEANPGAVFLIQDEVDEAPEQHEINDTGVLNLYELSNIIQFKYLGMRDKTTGEIIEKPTNIMVNYYGTVDKWIYKEI